MSSLLPTSRRAAALLATALLALTAASCGDDSGDGGQSGGDEQQVRSAVDGLYDALGDYDAEAVCERMTPAAQKQLAQGGIGTKASEDATCAESFGKFLALAKKSGGLKRTLTAKVGKVEVEGDKATVTVAFGAQKGPLPLEKIDGEWKVGILAAPSGGAR
jgi:hypothetical protein